VRVLHVVNTRQFRGGERLASELIRALKPADLTQRVVVLTDSTNGGIGYEAPGRILGSDDWSVPGLRIHPKALWALRRVIREWRPDLVHAHGGNTLKYLIPAAIGRRTSVVYGKIGLTPSSVSGRLKRGVHGQLMRRTDRVVAVAEAVRREVVDSFRVPKERVVMIPNAVDPDRMKPERGRTATRRSLGIPPEAPVVLSLGALTWEKDPVAHVELGARVIRERPEAVHVMVGEGPLESQVEAAIRRHNLDGQIRLMPPRADVPDLLVMSDVLLLASRTEGMPTCVIEAGFSGLPVAAYAIAGVPEVVIDGVTGRLTHPGDIDGLALHVLDLLGDKEKSRAMGEAARERCRSHFEIGMIAPQYLQLYEELIRS
jgi:glycosyltransferase involved in cell wall biosynthesis